ncbi:hypothetical protein HY346_01030 [Candidatus Microgenomates bacterium]|nr:hypothetical protein [Candidatus Microgenomates bacterium]
MNKQVNLLPDIKQRRQQDKRLRQSFVTGGIIALVVAFGIPILLLIIKGSQSLYLGRVQGQIDERKATIQSTPNISTMLTVKDHLNSLAMLYGQRVEFSELLGFLPAVIPKSVSLHSIDLSTDGQLSFSGVTPSYAEAEKFYEALLRAGVSVNAERVEPNPQLEGYFTSVNLSSVGGLSGSEVTFEITATFNPALIDGAPNG